jgi:hypothetical protein
VKKGKGIAIEKENQIREEVQAAELRATNCKKKNKIKSVDYQRLDWGAIHIEQKACMPCENQRKKPENQKRV